MATQKHGQNRQDAARTTIRHEEDPKTPGDGRAILAPRREEADLDVGDNLQHILAAMQHSLTKIDELSFRMDHMSERLDKHTARLDMVECHVLEVEDEQVTTPATQKNINQVLITLQTKSEDLKACFHRNNLRIVVLAESTNIDDMEHYMEQLLIDLLGQSDIFVPWEARSMDTKITLCIINDNNVSLLWYITYMRQ
ncbi:hypothetical protein NDU88_007652 [Pleurodeles waltl]|uniref:Uncharacterized protein n=1 Tax=Pleurodeles waltl TaxID=8319 RepID=A0AAV7U4B5_PLEWA|nr:hypothetical protein NDU88_007652 [Pleurodeles waltl]